MTRSSTEIFDCDRVNSYLDSYLLDQVPPPERRGMRLHIHRCPVCFAKVIERDPLQLFAPLSDEERGEHGWEGFWPAIHEGIAREVTRRATRRVRMRAVAAAAAVAAVALIGASYLVYRQAPAPVVAQLPGAVQPGPPPDVEPAGAPLPQTVERVRTTDSHDVQVYSMNYYGAPSGSTASGAGHEGQLTELVLIVDAEIDL